MSVRSIDSLATERRKWLALVVLCLGQLMIVLDATIVTVALPNLQRDLDFSQASLAWVVNAYLITFGSFLLLAGRFGDLIGRRRVFLSGLVLFTVASALCGAAQSQEMLIGARFLQGIGGAVTSSVILAIIVGQFPHPREQTRAMGVFSFVAAAGGSIGLLAGGVLTQTLSWHWIFFVNVPIGIAALVFGRLLIDETERLGLRRGIDVAGAVLLTVSLMLAVYTIVKTDQYGWASARTLLGGAGAAALLAGFLAVESRISNPLIPLRVFRSRTLTGANIVQVLLVVGLFGWFFLAALYLRSVLGYSAVETGLAFLPATLMIGAFSVSLTQRVMRRLGPRYTEMLGLALAAAGLVLFARVPVDASYLVDVFPGMLLLGAGLGLAFIPLITLAMAGVDPKESGLASGLVNTGQQMGGALGVSVLASVATMHTRHLTDGGTSLAPALTSGYHLAFAIAAVCAAAGVALAFLLLRPDGAQVSSLAVEPAGAALESEAAA